MKKKSIRFRDCLKTFTVDQDKAISPEETLKTFYARVESLDLKILNEVRRIDNGRLDIPVFFSVCGDDALALTGTKKQMGKGASPIQAEASACMELAERFSFFSFKNNSGNFSVRRTIKQWTGQGIRYSICIICLPRCTTRIPPLNYWHSCSITYPCSGLGEPM